MSTTKLKISAVINTKNEETNLPRLLKSINGWLDEVIVCDMYSSDKTIEIAESFGCKIVMHDDVGFVEPARKLAVESASNDWILMLDADELVNADLKAWIFNHFEDLDTIEFDGVKLPWIQYMSGKRIDYSDFGNQKHLRLFRKAQYSFSNKIHSRRVAIGDTKEISLSKEQGGLLHFNCGSFKRFLDKMNHYAYIEAGDIVSERGSYEFSVLKGLYAFISKFSIVYFRNKGYKDGLHGLHISMCMGLYSFLVRSYAHEISTVGNERSIQTKYDEIGRNETR